MGTDKGLIRIVCTVALLLSSATSYAVTGSWSSSVSSSPAAKQGPLPLPGVEALDEYQRQLLFASRNIEEGDYESARQNLSHAMEIRKDDPRLYEMLGIACDADREPKTAFANFLKAGDMYLKAGNTEKAGKILGWLRTFSGYADEVRDFEGRVRAESGN